MIVILEDPIFASSPTPQLLSAIRFGFEGWHLVQTDPLFDPSADRAVNRWLAAQDQSSREEVELAFTIGLEEEAMGLPSEISVRVGNVDTIDWNTSPPRLSLSRALRLLRKPLRLLVENRQSDGGFLRRVVPEPWRAKLLRSLDNHWVEFEHGGGSGMLSRIRETDWEGSIRLWALFDSDAREPGRPSRASEDLRSACLEKRVPHHRLHRRTIESYLPVRALESWVHLSSGRTRLSRRRAVAAFASMSSEQRHYYNMKGGFEKDRRDPLADIPEFYAEFADHRDLQSGFGQDIAVLFQEQEFSIREEWLASDGQQQEMLNMVQSIFRHL